MLDEYLYYISIGKKITWEEILFFLNYLYTTNIIETL